MRPKINDFINRSFRDVADCDYITARACHRLRLFDQFLWSGLQALEKYLKAIMLYHDRDTRKIGHDLEKALRRVESIPDIRWNFSDETKKFFCYLTTYGSDRYFSQQTHMKGLERLQLDEEVWSVRRYCQDFETLKQQAQKKQDDSFAEHVRYIQSEECRRQAHKFRLPGGYLEKVLDTKNCLEARKSLVWRNFYYGSIKKGNRTVRIPMMSKTPGHYLTPEIYPWVKDRVQLSCKVKAHFEENINDLSKAKRSSGRVIFQRK